jgi:4-aminobutyrate aminotransferase-like enzyme
MAWRNIRLLMLPKILSPIPGPKSLELAAALRRYESRNVTFVSSDWPIFWQRAQGTNVWDADGNRFLDLTSAFGVAGLGHGNPSVCRAIHEQSGELWHAMGDVHPTALKVELCRMLSELTFERWGAGSGKTIFGNSGFEAVEAALKTALLYSGKPGVIAFSGAYHGLGYGALEVGGIPYFKEPFRRQLKEFATPIPYPRMRSAVPGEGKSDFPECTGDYLSGLRKSVAAALESSAIGAILVEPIQGRGGTVVPPIEFLRTLREICDENGLLLVADEIFTGLNRTGKLFACDHFQVVPDIICLGKALTTGFPLSACVGRSEVMDAWPDSTGEALHTSTFLGNPLGCRMAITSLGQHREPKLTAHVLERGARLKAGLARLKSPKIGEIRGVGLMLGMEIVNPDGSPDGDYAVHLMKEALKAGLILLSDSPESNVLSFAPPFEISDEEIGFVIETLQTLLEA